MLDVRAVVKFRQHAQESEAANGAPADEFDQAVGGVGMRSDEHGAAGVLAVVEREEEAAALVPIFVVVAAKSERTAAELDYAQENAEEIAERTERLEVAIRQRCYIGGESHAQQIEGEDFTFGVREAEEIDGALAIF